MKQLIMMLGLCFLICGCIRHEVESKSEVDVKPIEVKPIHITIDINVKVDRALDDFFGDLDEQAETQKVENESKSSK